MAITPKIDKDLLARLANVHVLVADDDSRMLSITREVLHRLGFRNVLVAHDGSEALAIMKEKTIDLLITDWQMEPVDGLNLLRYLRTMPDSPNRFLPIIMLTANAERENIFTARDNGITEFVVKPYSAKTLADRITMLIESPRNFILAPNFKGPDRRRREARPPDGKEKRKRKVGIDKLAEKKK